MTPLANAQSTLRTRILTDPYFASGWVVLDDGTKDDAIEKLLAEEGMAVVVTQAVDADFDTGTFPGKTTHGLVTFGVEVWRNDTVENLEATPRIISEAAARIVTAIIAGNNTPGRAGWQVPSFAIVNTDPGLSAYVVLAQTRVVF